MPANNRAEEGAKKKDMRLIDAHIHLDLYQPVERRRILAACPDNGVEALIAVSYHLESCRMNYRLAIEYPRLVKPAYGHHPEQAVPIDADKARLINWMNRHREGMTAVGEVGLPYYSRKEHESGGGSWDQGPYLEWLEAFIRLAADWDRPIILHAVYEDATLVCDMLERHSIRRAHFHWFKGDSRILQRLMRNGYYVSLTPDIEYEAETRTVARSYPLELLMTETDGPWPFEGSQRGRLTEPAMMNQTIRTLAGLKGISEGEAGDAVYRNARSFYSVD